jgi:hypothetical protein
VPDRLRLAAPDRSHAVIDPPEAAAGALAAGLAALVALPGLLARLATALERQPAPAAPPDRPEGAELRALAETVERLVQAVERMEAPDRQLAIGKEELAREFGVSIRLIERAIHRGEIPPPVRCGTKLLWSTEVIRQFLAGGRAHIAK